jgi:hypothetical protein
MTNNFYLFMFNPLLIFKPEVERGPPRDTKLQIFTMQKSMTIHQIFEL